jgi:hypothetical protein
LTGSKRWTARGVDHALAQQDRARGHDQVAGHGGALEGEVAREQQHDAGVRDEHAAHLGRRQAVAWDEEVGQHHGVHRVGVQENRAVGCGGEPDADVHRADLDREDQPERDERAPLAGANVEDPAMPGPPRVAQERQRAEHEAEEGEPQRRRVREADLHRDRIAAPHRGEEERGDGATPIERPEGRH